MIADSVPHRPTVQLPWCKAQCPAEKPTPPPDYNIVINPNKTSLTDKLWEDESLWYYHYRCLLVKCRECIVCQNYMNFIIGMLALERQTE